MTDGADGQLAELYFYRAGMSANNPAAIVLNGGRERLEVLTNLEKLGMTALFQRKGEQQEIQKVIPDTAVLTENQMKAMPPYVQYFRCGRSIETGQPHCGDMKFNNKICKDRRFETSWHPGWYV